MTTSEIEKIIERLINASVDEFLPMTREVEPLLSDREFADVMLASITERMKRRGDLQTKH